MTSPAAPKNQTPLDDEISLLDIIQFFKTNFKRMLFFIIMGGILGYLYGKLAPPEYDGSVLISPAKVAGQIVVEPNITLTMLNMNSYYSKETFLACNPTFYKDKDKDQDAVIDYDMKDIVKTSITKDERLLKITMSHSNKETVKACLDNIAISINASHKIIADPLIESKKNQLNLAETKLKLAEEFYEALKSSQIKNLKTNEHRFSSNALYTIFLDKTFEVSRLLDEINDIKTQLSSGETNSAGMVLPVSIERKSFPSPKLGLLIGLFLGGVFSIFSSFVRNMTIN